MQCGLECQPAPRWALAVTDGVKAGDQNDLVKNSRYRNRVYCEEQRLHEAVNP